ncbi:MAG: BON domain-containing protein [Gammaproteobacteria bacterium]|nr:BON domain-containing protein [Gammaproteobacteria bacterium]
MAAMLCAASGGCTISTTPDGHIQTEWAGNHARQQAAEQDRDRALALQIRQALANDPVLAPLDLGIFVDHGNVRLCGDYPDGTSRDRAVGLISIMAGVASVNTRCGGE